MAWRKQTPEGHRVAGRHAHTMVTVDDAVLFLFGGTRGTTPNMEFFRCDTDKQVMAWKIPDAFEAGPSQRAGHSCTYADDPADCLVMFGGYSGSAHVSDTHSFHLKNSMWKRHTHGIPPEGRKHHAVCQVDCGSMLLWGGETDKGVVNDVWILQTASDTFTWAKKTVSKLPAPRHSHTATLIGPGRVLVFGGCGKDGRELGDVHVLKVSEDELKFVAPKMTGKPPAARWGHSATRVGDKVIIFGGRDSRGYLSDVVALDVETMTWEDVDTGGGGPTGRAYHTATAVRGQLFVHGGQGQSEYGDLFLLDVSMCGFAKRAGAGPSAGSSTSLASKSGSAKSLTSKGSAPLLARKPSLTKSGSASSTGAPAGISESKGKEPANKISTTGKPKAKPKARPKRSESTEAIDLKDENKQLKRMVKDLEKEVERLRTKLTEHGHEVEATHVDNNSDDDDDAGGVGEKWQGRIESYGTDEIL